MIFFFRNLQITGEGAGAILRFDPGSLDLGTVLPMSPGVEKIVTIASQCDYPVEIYSSSRSHFGSRYSPASKYSSI